jgi:hypothetical protein
MLKIYANRFLVSFIAVERNDEEDVIGVEVGQGVIR